MTAIVFLLWKAVKVMSRGWLAASSSNEKVNSPSTSYTYSKGYTIHPELLDKAGNITDEELLTVRFSNDTDSSIEAESSSD
tara:strand:- start:11833 stop:12075 length:243 start_codon:yes stop_codon:yes gene_type:complete